MHYQSFQTSKMIRTNHQKFKTAHGSGGEETSLGCGFGRTVHNKNYMPRNNA
jgi:hypothetical protein